MANDLHKGTDLSVEAKRALLADLLRQKTSRVRTAPASFAQQRVWFLDRLEPDNAAFNISRPIRMVGDLNVSVLRQTFNELLARHDALRTSFTVVDGEPVQSIAPKIEIELPIVDLAHLTPESRASELSRLVTLDAKGAFDLGRAPLIRAGLIKLSSREHVLLLTVHHIISDGWSMGILFRELAVLYSAFAEGRPSPLSKLSIQYSDFAAWQRRQLQGDVLEKHLGYWKKQLAGAPPILELPIDKPRPATQTFNGAYYSLVLPQKLSEAITPLAHRSGATLFMTLLAAFQVLLSRYTNQQDVPVGTPIANRTRRETEDVIGFFVNTLVLRTDLSGDPTFENLLKRVRETALEAYAHQDLPFEKLVAELRPERHLSYSPLFQVLFAVQNVPKDSFQLPDLELHDSRGPGLTSKFDLSLYVGEDDSLRLTFEYNTDLFEAATIQRMATQFQTLLEDICADPGKRISELSLLTAADKAQILSTQNETQSPYPCRCIHQVFEEQVAGSPAALSVLDANQKLSFAALNERANQLARYLQTCGVGPETRVAICLNRSVDMVVGLLAILKAGGAFVPIDGNYPDERISFMLRDANVSVLLTTSSFNSALAPANCRVVCLDREHERIAAAATSNLDGAATPQNAAYVIYTSGSTGRPKGVLGSHSALLNRFHWMWRLYPFGESEVCCQKTSLSFVDSIWEIFGPLLQGVPLVILSDQTVKDPAQLLAALERNKVSRLLLVPSLLRMLVEAGDQFSTRLSNLQFLVCSGETLTPDLAQRVRSELHHCRLLNLYGSSEVAADVTYHEVLDPHVSRIPIGKPLANTQIFILDGNLQPAPVGVPGEIYVGGAGLARGYLNNPQLTAEKFIAHPFSQKPGERLFKTGDIGRFGSDGNIEYIGRRDQQIKLRGFRIELSEIESVLATHPSVLHSVVTLDESTGSKRLLPYVVLRAPTANVEALRAYLREQLPEHMVPAAFVILETLPLTATGKIDRRALPIPTDSRQQLAGPYIQASTDLEKKIVHVWETALGISNLGTTDNFFDIGGHSLLLVKVHEKLRGVVERDLSITDLFRYPTIHSLAEYLSEPEAPAFSRVQDRARKQKDASMRRRLHLKAR